VVGSEPQMCATFVTRNGPTDFSTLQPWDCDAPRLQNFPEPSGFAF
jgi:protein-L-isoaspartate(D-aspartate) O-methyltransferase